MERCNAPVRKKEYMFLRNELMMCCRKPFATPAVNIVHKNQADVEGNVEAIRTGRNQPTPVCLLAFQISACNICLEGKLRNCLRAR